MTEFVETGIFISMISNRCMAKNKLQNALLENIQKFNRQHVHDPDDFLFEIKLLTKKLSEQYPRCTPLALDIFKNVPGEDIQFVISDILYMGLYVVQGKFQDGQCLPFLPVSDKTIKRKSLN